VTIGRIAGAAILATSFGGVLLASGFGAALLNLEQRQSQLTVNSATVGDSLRLQDALREWVLLGDLVYGSGETYLVQGAQSQGKLAARVLDQLAESPLANGAKPQVAALRGLIQRNEQRLERAATMASGSHGSLPGLTPEWDEQTAEAVSLFEQLRAQIKSRSEQVSAEYRQLRRQVILGGSALSVLYLLAVAALWGWMRRKLVQPLRHLTQAAEQALSTGEPMQVVEEGPVEIRRMANSANRLTQLLEEKVQQRTAELEQEVAIRRTAESESASARDRAESASRAKSQFIANMSHELRTPMNGVLGMTELLQVTLLSARQLQFTAVIRQSATNLLTLINDILDFSKMDAGKLELSPKPFDLEDLVSNALELLSERAQGKRLPLLCQLPRGLRSAYVGDAARLQQVLVNLIGNAVKFTDSGRVVVRVRQSDCSAEQVRLRFEVSDTGIGIRPENQAAIFESFTQEDVSNTRRFGGTGLGLAISKQLLQLMQGEIGVQSEFGVGSTFWFELAIPALPALECAGLQGRTALLVDTDSVSAEILRLELEACGMTVTVAGSAAAALSLVTATGTRAATFDLFLLDGNPRQRSTSLLQQLRTATGSATPFIALDVLAPENEPASSGLVPGGVVLLKPMRRSRLRAAAYELLARPAAGARDALSPVQHEHEAIVAGSASSVLLVEDNPVNQQVACAMLKHMGCEITTAGNGREAVERWQSGHFDMVLMDCQMPVLDGYAATGEIRRLERAQSRPHSRIVALTANAMPNDRAKCLAAGMDDYLAKPFSLAQLREAVHGSAATRAPRALRVAP
jgi:signal transduction histidine kinase/CheY-like chemotaxis protein